MQPYLSNPTAIANAVNSFFIDKIRKLKEEFEPAQNDVPLAELKKYLSKKSVPEEGFKLKELNDNDIAKLLKTLKGKKSLGLDWICGYSLKIASKSLEKELKVLINLSIRPKKFVDSRSGRTRGIDLNFNFIARFQIFQKCQN